MPGERNSCHDRENMSNKTIRWGVRCELARRGGLRSQKRPPGGEIVGVIRQLITSIRREEGHQKEVESINSILVRPPGLGNGSPESNDGSST